MESCLRFKIVAKMTPKVADNFHNDWFFKSINYRCVGCLQEGRGLSDASLETEQHITKCDAYSDLREHLDLNNTADFVGYFQAVIRRRITNSD